MHINATRVQASDIYLKMAIGNAPWPIGVDQVGIHMRPSRETISMRYVAHVLNDETQRKFIQGNLPSTNATKVFQIDQNTGSIHLSSNLDYETVPNYNLMVKAYEMKNPDSKAFMFVKITYNYNFFVSQNPLILSK